MYVQHQAIQEKAVEQRQYQAMLARKAAREPLLVVLPTGLGKTVVALRAMLDRWDRDPDERVLVLAPTKPLVEQHAHYFRRVLKGGQTVHAMTGEVGAAKRQVAWGQGRVVVSTPQTAHNDVLRGTLDLDDFGFLVVDEAHRGVGRYPYVYLAQRFQGHRLGITASPGDQAATIRAVLTNLRLSRAEVRRESDPDVAPYVHDIETKWIRVRPDATLVRIAKVLQSSLGQCALDLRRLGLLGTTRGLPTRKQLLELGGRLRAEASRGSKRSAVFKGLSLQARALKIQHALELCETQGPGPLAAFLQRLAAEARRPGGAKATRDWVASADFARALESALAAEAPHPKVARLVGLVDELVRDGARRVLVFSHFRETAELIEGHLQGINGVEAARFVGHARVGDRRGLTKKEQQHVVDSFRDGTYNVLVATSVGEEGLDLPETDAVVLFEPVPSGIRMVQRRGRTGRRSDGRLYVLMTEGTRDEAYYWMARRREKRMQAELASLRRSPPMPVEPAAPRPRRRPELGPAVEVLVDTREFQSTVARRLVDHGVAVRAAALDVGDYRVGDTVVERKSVKDLAASIIDGRFFSQVPRLAEEDGVLLVEGSLSTDERLSRNAIAGAVASALVDHGLRSVSTADEAATAAFLMAVARRQTQPKSRRGRVKPPQVSRDASVAETVMASLPGVGGVLACRLAARFGSVWSLCRADAAQIAEVDGVGAARAQAICDALREPASLAEVHVPEALAPKGGDGAAGAQGADGDREVAAALADGGQ